MMPLKNVKILGMKFFFGIVVSWVIGNLHTIKGRIYNQVKEKEKMIAPKWDSFYNHVICKKGDNNIETSVKKRNEYYSKVYKHMARTQNCLLPTIVKVLLPKLQTSWHEVKQQRLCNLPQSYIFCSKVIPRWNYRQC